MKISDEAVNRARAVLAAYGPIPPDSVIRRAVEAAVRPHGEAARPKSRGAARRRYLSREQIRQVPCPECGAPAGSACRGRGQASHMARMQKAQAELPDKPVVTGRPVPDDGLSTPPWE